MRRIDLPGGAKISSMAWSSGFWVAICAGSGTVIAAGLSRTGALGCGEGVKLQSHVAAVPGVPPARLIACSDRTTLIVTRDGGVWVSGANDHAQLGFDSDGKSVFTAVAVTVPFDASEVTAVAAGPRHSLVLLANGDLWYVFGWRRRDNSVPTIFLLTIYGN